MNQYYDDKSDKDMEKPFRNDENENPSGKISCDPHRIVWSWDTEAN